jgi:hypothetical protein
MLGVADDVGRDRQEQMRDFVVVEISSDREIGVAPERPKMKATRSCSIRRRVCSTVFDEYRRRRG